MSKKKLTFGQVLRKTRLEKGYTLRRFAEEVGLSPTYVLQVDQWNCDPPTAARVRCMAQILGENVDESTSLAGQVPEDLPSILNKRPAQLAAFMREVSNLTSAQFQALSEQLTKLKKA